MIGVYQAKSNRAHVGGRLGFRNDRHSFKLTLLTTFWRTGVDIMPLDVV